MLKKRQCALIELPFESKPLAAVHTFFMRFAIDVYWLDSKKRIIGMKKGIKPCRLASPETPAKYIFEAPAGKLRLKAGEKLVFKGVDNLETFKYKPRH